MTYTLTTERNTERNIRYAIKVQSEDQDRIFNVQGWAEIPWGLSKNEWEAKVQTTSYGAVSAADAINIASALTYVAELARDTADEYNRVGLKQIEVTRENHREQEEIEL